MRSLHRDRAHGLPTEKNGRGLRLSTNFRHCVCTSRRRTFSTHCRCAQHKDPRKHFRQPSLGGAAIVLELVDSLSDTVIVRAVSAKSVDQRGALTDSNPVINTAQVRRHMRQWARWIRRALEQVVAVDEQGKIVLDKN